MQYVNQNSSSFLIEPDNYQFINHLKPHYNRGLRGSVYITMIFFFIVFGVAAYVCWHVWDVHNQYEQFGVSTQGTITSKTYSSGRSTTYYLHYRFETPDGKENYDTQDVDWDTYHHHSVGDKLNILYLSNDPTESKIAGREADTFLYILFGLIMALSLFFIALFVRNILRRNLLERTGRLIPARLVQSYLTEKRNRRRRYYVLSVDYQFQNPYGQYVTNRDKYVRNDLSGQPLPPPGTPLVVLYATDKLYTLL